MGIQHILCVSAATMIGFVLTPNPTNLTLDDRMIIRQRLLGRAQQFVRRLLARLGVLQHQHARLFARPRRCKQQLRWAV